MRPRLPGMGRDVQDNVLVLVGGTVLAVGATDVHLRYVKPEMQWLLVVSGLLLMLVGLRDVARSAAQDDAGERPAEGHRAPPAAWLLLAPVVVMALVTPGALGSFSADRAPSRPPVLDDRGFLPLPQDVDGAVDLTLRDLTSRVAYAPDTLEGRRVRLLGFVSPRPDGWAVTRLQISCCAADTRPIRVRALGGDTVPPRDSWVLVEGTAAPLQDGARGEVTAGIQVERVTSVPAPSETYE